MKVPVFLFHRVSEEKDSLWPPMTPQLFEKIIKLLSIRYTIKSIEDFFLNPHEKTSKPIACICFDDGFKDNLEYAAPILLKYKCPASFYVVSSCIDNELPTWTYELDYSISKTSIKKISLKGLVPENLESTVLDSQYEKEQFARKLKPYLKTINDSSRILILQELKKQMNDISIPKSMMNWKEVNQLHSAGFIIGSHSVTHPLLGKLQNEEEISKELLFSGQRIEQQIGKFPVTISYPIGSYDERVMRIAKQAGYKLGLAVEQKFADTITDSLFAIPRVELYQENWVKTQFRMSGLLGKVKMILGR